MSTSAEELFTVMVLRAGPWPVRQHVRDLRDRRVQWFQAAGLIDGYTDNNWTDSPFYTWITDRHYPSGYYHVAISITREQLIEYLDCCVIPHLAPSA